jgi:hypothetical protein
VDYPVRFRIQRAEHYSRLTTLLRLILVIPHLVWVIGYSIVSGFVTVYAWVAILYRGSYPRGAFEFQERFLRYAARVFCYALLTVDRYPPFTGDERATEGYPVALSVDYQPQLSRLTTALRLPAVISNILIELGGVFAVVAFLGILFLAPAELVELVLAVFALLLGVVAWIVIVATGRFPGGMFDLIELALRYGIRVGAFTTLMTDRYPWFQPEAEPPAPAAAGAWDDSPPAV